MTRNRIGATLLVAAGLAGTVGLTDGSAAGSGRHSDPSCTLVAESLGGSPVVFLSVTGLAHGAWFQIDWTEPQITQVQYMWSTSTGVLEDSVMNDQGSGVYSATVWSLDKHGNPVAQQAACSVPV